MNLFNLKLLMPLFGLLGKHWAIFNSNFWVTLLAAFIEVTFTSDKSKQTSIKGTVLQT